MMVLGLLMGMVGIFTSGISAFFYTAGHEPAGITGMAIGTGLLRYGSNDLPCLFGAEASRARLRFASERQDLLN